MIPNVAEIAAAIEEPWKPVVVAEALFEPAATKQYGD